MGTLNEDKVDALLARAQREVDAGLLPSCQLALGLDGEIVAEASFGDATVDTRYVIFSATKATVASAFWLLIADGTVDVTKPVRHYLPEFMAEGEPERGDAITVEMVMLHTSGFPHAPLGHPLWTTREGRLDTISKWRCNWEPGTAFEYHATSAHWILAEIIHRLTGEDHRDFVRSRIFEPHKLTRLQLGVPAAEQGDVAELIACGEPPTAEDLQAAFGISELPVTEVTEEALLGFNQTEVREVGVPGGGAVSTAADLARFYQALLHNPAGVWDDAVLHDAKTNVRNTFPDKLTGVPASRTLGLVTAGADGKSSFRGMGKTQSAGAFGHNGAGGQIAFADPETGLSFVYLTNGLDAHMIRQARRTVALASIAGDCATA